ncbi:CFEM domain-containing protein [Colletotrichum zoysiae]|uniref:CFEM domain-containing protein n=1 Tax=Colletotrichum zoysiae TaxID=1216348 RepID=A0AAD9M9I2_9PEZI|nr:CFEM domain-containing protein [Colletotrichum zoysiae]
MVTGRFFALLICVLGLGSVVAAVDMSSTNAIPNCAVNCILQEIGRSSCYITNQTCICHDKILAGHVQTCVQAKCTVKEILVAQNQSMTACGVAPTQHDGVMQWFRGLLFCLPTLFIIIRVANKLMKISPWGWDDLTILIAYVHLASFLPASYLSEQTGGGRDIWTLTPGQITNYLIFFFTFGLLYMTCLFFIKASILFLYLRIFPDEIFRRVLWCTQLFGLLLWLSFTVTSFAVCQPLNFFWNGWAGESKGKCFDLNAFGISHGALNLALDVWMLILPASQLYNLRMKRKKKVGVMLMFSVGIFLTAASAYRVKALVVFAKSYNITAESFETSIISHIELCVGIFVACLPSTRQVWRVVPPKILRAMRLSSGLQNSPKASPDVSQASQRAPGAFGRPPVAGNNEASMAHLVGDLKRIDLNNLPDPSATETECPKTPGKWTDTTAESTPDSSRGRRGLV